MSSVLEIQSAISQLTLEERGVLESWWRSQPGVRLRKTVADAWAGNAGVPTEVKFVSDQPIGVETVARSHELIRKHGWNV
ncbi:hypothetical protein [Prosthecobacter sp.]|uniref:hypothetical protein n=1 Tax=Prosthecobacter sp. TaxID=1965333 RepID=UPI0037839473